MKRNQLNTVFLTIIFLCLSLSAWCQHKWTFEVLPGVVKVAPAQLIVHQEGYDDLNFTAHYAVDPLKLPIYYSLRTSFCLDETTAIELEMNHLKIYLENKPAEIQSFSISHGYNQFWVNIAKRYFGFCARLGFGTVIAHPENTVRGKALLEDSGHGDLGYQIGGFSSQVALQKRFFLSDHFFLSLEAKYNMSSSKVDVADGYAKVPVFALHGLFGIGYQLH